MVRCRVVVVLLLLLLLAGAEGNGDVSGGGDGAEVCGDDVGGAGDEESSNQAGSAVAEDVAVAASLWENDALKSPTVTNDEYNGTDTEPERTKSVST